MVIGVREARSAAARKALGSFVRFEFTTSNLRRDSHENAGGERTDRTPKSRHDASSRSPPQCSGEVLRRGTAEERDKLYWTGSVNGRGWKRIASPERGCISARERTHRRFWGVFWIGGAEVRAGQERAAADVVPREVRHRPARGCPIGGPRVRRGAGGSASPAFEEHLRVSRSAERTARHCRDCGCVASFSIRIEKTKRRDAPLRRCSSGPTKFTSWT